MVGNIWDDAEYIYMGLITNEYVINDISNDDNIIIATMDRGKLNK
jgi:hypothetical protein